MAAIIPCDIPAHRWDDALHVACSTFNMKEFYLEELRHYRHTFPATCVCQLAYFVWKVVGLSSSPVDL